MTTNETTGVAALFYCLPALIAIVRGHRSALGIVALTLLLGWTVIGWVVAFIWSLTGAVRGGAAGGQVVVSVNASPTVNVLAPQAVEMSAETAVRIAMLEGALEAQRLDALARAAGAQAPGRLVERRGRDSDPR